MISVLIWRKTRATVSLIQARDVGVIAWFGSGAAVDRTRQDLAGDLLLAEARLRLDVLHCHRLSAPRRDVI